MDEEKQISEKVNLTWDYYSEYVNAPNREGTTINGINVVSPAFFYLDTNGNLKENIGDSGKAYIKWAKNNGYKIWPMVSNGVAANKSLNITSNIMNDYEKRKKLIESIVNKCVEYELDGINIDFENMKSEDKDMYSRFIIELEPRLKEIGMVLSVDVTAPDGGDTWSMCFDRHVIGNVADYTIFMAYDQYGASSTKPGTTAGYNWIETNLKKIIEYDEVKADKIILAIIALVALVSMGIFLLMWQNQTEGATALVSIDGEQIMELKLEQEENRQIDLSEYGVEVVLEIKDHQIRFLSSDCPDHLCIGFGWIDHEPQSAVCMPNRVAISIVGE